MCVHRAGLLGRAAVIGAAFERPADPGVERMVGGFEGQHQDRRGAVPGPGIVRLLRVENSAIGRVESGLSDCPDGAGCRKEIAKSHRPARPEARPVLQPHPRLSDHPEDAFRTDEQAIGAGSRSGAG